MSDNSIAWAINRWLWETSGIQDDYGTSTYTPFYPIRSTAENSEQSIVYVERVTIDPQNIWEESSEITYIIFENDYDKLVRIRNKLIRASKNLDRGAKHFKNWLRTTDWQHAGQYLEEFVPRYISFVVAPDVTPPGQQGEAFQQMVRMRIEYSRAEAFAL